MNVSRRDFICGTGSLGLVGCAEALWGESCPLRLSPIREGGVDEVLRLTPIEIPVGASAPFGILHVSDTHLNFWDVTDYAGNAAKESFFGQRWVRFPQALNSFLATLDYAAARGFPVFHTGDLIDWNTAANVNLLRRSLKGVDLFYALGNHEYHSSDGKMPGLTPDAARARMQTVISNDLTVSSRILNGVNFVAMDNGETNLRPETVARVQAEFAKGFPVVLLCHIPPTYTPSFLENANRMRARILRGQGESETAIAKLPYPTPIEPRYDDATRTFYGWLRRQRLLKAILCGHAHVEEQDVFSETAKMYVAGGNYEGCGYVITFK